MNHTLPSFFLKVDRSKAVVRAVWRLLCAAVTAGLLLQVRPNWGLLWLTEPASWFALAMMVFCLGIVVLALVIVGVRWLLVSVWPGPLGVRVTPKTLDIDLGPLGRSAHEWADLNVEIVQEIDPDLLDQLPDDSINLRIRRRGAKEDLAHTVQVAANLDDEEMTRLFRPYLEMGRISNGAR